MRITACCLAALGAIGSTGCEQFDGWRERADGRLALSLEAPAPLDWGGRGTVRVALENQGQTATEGAIVELYMPSWLEFGSVDPPGTEVTLVSGEAGTRLAYRFAGELQPGERRMVVQHVRVIAGNGPATPTASPGDTLPAARPAPADRVMRARLVNARGEPIGAEVHAVLGFRGAPDVPLLPPDTAASVALGGDRVGPVRLGMSRDELRRQLPTSRDTVLGRQGGALERGLIVPLADDRRIVAVFSDVGVERIIVRDPAITTPEGFGVGTRLEQLRTTYGTACAEARDGRVLVRFAASPHVSFVLATALPADTAALRQDAASLPDDASISEIWVHARRPGC